MIEEKKWGGTYISLLKELSPFVIRDSSNENITDMLLTRSFKISSSLSISKIDKLGVKNVECFKGKRILAIQGDASTLLIYFAKLFREQYTNRY